ncbi:hypothetical protein BDEG_27834 [Batrachochytrium dendrobatidis JEL423]|uniref:Uncharacterized protein n=1 Tax=Batrachochytrium dendrobatidis (strain JEL423) TaxID=403673 RepID=A0A177WXC7_BATDL|nr:hypothetical protein BDEG_27834 [Batrachochytrium dendrobatidis JEL423]
MSGTTAINSGRQTTLRRHWCNISMCIMTIKCMSESVVLTCLMSYILTNTDTSCMKLLQYMDIALLRRHWGNISMCIMTTKCMSESVVLACLMSNILTNTDTSCMKLLQYMDIALLRRHWGNISMCIMTTKCMSESVVLTCLMSNILTNTDTSCMKLLQYMYIALYYIDHTQSMAHQWHINVDVWRVNNSVHSGRTMSGTTAINSGRQTTNAQTVKLYTISKTPSKSVVNSQSKHAL